MKEKGCYFVHTIQVTKALDVSENNEAIDTKKLTPADKLDILYAGNPTISVSSLRPNTQDGTFYGGFGVLLSQGEVVSANPSDEGTIATSLTERHIVGGARNSKEDIDRAIDRKHGGNGKSYNRPVAHLPPTLVAPFFTLSFLIPHFQMKIPHTTRYLHDQIIKVCPPVT